MGENRKENKQKKDKGKKVNEKQDIVLDVVFFTSLILAIGSFCLASEFEHRHMFELVVASMFFGAVAFLTWMLMGA